MLAVVFGECTITMNGNGVNRKYTTQGIWHGKSPQDWVDEKLILNQIP